MGTYKDATGYTWAVNLDVKALKEIRRRVTDADGLRVDLLDVQNGATIAKVLGDPILLTDILWVVCEKQAKNDGITQDAFYAAHRGNVFMQAMDALVEAISDFFPELEGIAYREIYKTSKRTREEQGRKMKEALKKTEAPEPAPEQPKSTVDKKETKAAKKESTKRAKSGS